MLLLSLNLEGLLKPSRFKERLEFRKKFRLRKRVPD
jgi:hypothetical protein